MNLLHSTTANALEAAIRARTAIDPQAREMVCGLDGHTIELSVDGNRLFIRFKSGRATVSTSTSEEPALTVVGSVVDVSKLLLSNQGGPAQVSGDDSLLRPLHMIFKPSFDSFEMAEQAKATAEYGVATVRSTLEGLASEFTANRNDHDRLAELSEQIAELRSRVSDLEDRIQALEDR